MSGAAIEISAFVPEDLIDLAPRQHERRFFSYVDDLETVAAMIAATGHNYTGRIDGRIVGCGGILPLRPTVGELWLALSDRFRLGRPDRAWVSLARIVEDGLSSALRGPFHRLQVALEKEFRPGRAFARHLGFVEEGLMRKYGPTGADYIRYARTR